MWCPNMQFDHMYNVLTSHIQHVRLPFNETKSGLSVLPSLNADQRNINLATIQALNNLSTRCELNHEPENATPLRKTNAKVNPPNL